jgi:hypothetical protein
LLHFGRSPSQFRTGPACFAVYLQSGGFGAFVADKLEKYTVYLGDRTPLEDRLTANISAIYNNLDRV